MQPSPSDFKLVMDMLRMLSQKLDSFIAKTERQAARQNAKGRKASGSEPVADRLISVAEAAKLLCRSEYCIHEDIRNGRIPAKKNGKAYKLSFNTIQNIIAEQC